MWSKMISSCIRGLLSVIIVFSFLSTTGCWILRSWKDYMPICKIGLDKDVRSYRGYFYPRISGEHVLSLRITKKTEGDVFVGLRFKGEIRLFHDGNETVIHFDRSLNQVTLPPTPFNIHLKTFEANSIKCGDNDYGIFDVTIEGDIGGFLEKEPQSYLSISFCDSE